MRDAFISIVAIFALAAISRCSDVGKNSFNFYKDYLRARFDDINLEPPAEAERMLHFYRTPVQLHPGLLPVLEQEYRKRTSSAFKNHMLSKESPIGIERPSKRNSKMALSLMMQAKQQQFPYMLAMDDKPDQNYYHMN